MKVWIFRYIYRHLWDLFFKRKKKALNFLGWNSDWLNQHSFRYQWKVILLTLVLVTFSTARFIISFNLINVFIYFVTLEIKRLQWFEDSSGDKFVVRQQKFTDFESNVKSLNSLTVKVWIFYNIIFFFSSVFILLSHFYILDFTTWS